MSKSCVRVLVIIFNILFVVIGLGLLGLSLWVYLDESFEQYKGLNKDVFNILLFTVMGIGGLTALIALCGCCGAFYMSQCLLGVFFILLLIIFLLEISVAICGVLLPTYVQSFVNSSSYVLVEKAKVDDRAWRQMELTQQMFKCCGDSRGAEAFSLMKFPRTCCVNDRVACTKLSILVNKHLPKCPDQVYAYFQKYRIYVLATLIGVAAIELFGMIFAMVLCCHMRRYVEDGYIGVNYT